MLPIQSAKLLLSRTVLYQHFLLSGRHFPSIFTSCSFGSCWSCDKCDIGPSFQHEKEQLERWKSYTGPEQTDFNTSTKIPQPKICSSLLILINDFTPQSRHVKLSNVAIIPAEMSTPTLYLCSWIIPCRGRFLKKCVSVPLSCKNSIVSLWLPVSSRFCQCGAAGKSLFHVSLTHAAPPWAVNVWS